MKDAFGHVIGAICSIKDMTAGKQLEKLMREKRDLDIVKTSVETMKDSIQNSLTGLQLLKVEASKSPTVNQSAIKMFDRSIADILSFLNKMASMQRYSEVDMGFVKVIDVDGRYR